MSNDRRHHWDHQQCYECHYLGIDKRGTLNKNYRNGSPLANRWRGFKTKRGKRTKLKLDVNEKNIDLYCKLSQIIRDKPCVPSLVLHRKKRSVTSFP